MPSLSLRNTHRFALICGATLAMVAVAVPDAGSQTAARQLISRDELSAAANHAEQSGNVTQAAAIRTRLTEGDFQTGDRIVLSYYSDVTHTDTLIVRPGRVVDLPENTEVHLSGVLRSELKDRLALELLRFVKAQNVSATALTRIGVLGEVTHPGYFAVRSDMLVTDAIMAAGGPTVGADVDRTIVRRAGSEYRHAEATRQAVASGLTLDQFGLAAGDEIVVAKQTQHFSPAGMLGIAASFAAIFVAVKH
jgi:protein involved in polysaccharide export with SLBB domain